MPWPFHCPPPSVSFVGGGAVEVAWWKEREADLSRLQPLHRAVYTYSTWGPLPNSWGREAPYAGSLLGEELLSIGDPLRCDGTCTALDDGTLSAVTTMYNSADVESVAAADFQPCVERIVPQVPCCVFSAEEVPPPHKYRRWHLRMLMRRCQPVLRRCHLRMMLCCVLCCGGATSAC